MIGKSLVPIDLGVGMIGDSVVPIEQGAAGCGLRGGHGQAHEMKPILAA